MARNINGGTDHIWWTIPPVPNAVGTIAFWMRSTQTLANAIPLSYWGPTSRNGLAFLFNGVANKISAQCYPNTSSSTISITSSTSVNNGSQHHIAFSYDRASGGACTLYVDGVQEASANSSGAWTTASSGFNIQAGDQFDTFWPTYVGDIWGIGHWNAQMSADEIAALAKGFPSKLIKPASLIFDAPLISDAHDIRGGNVVNALIGTTVVPHGRSVGGEV